MANSPPFFLLNIHFLMPINRTLAAQINRMTAKDQTMRRTAENTMRFDRDLDIAHTKKLTEIVKVHGWPTIPLVGKKASRNAWLLIQHANHDLGFQKKCLARMEQTVKQDKRSIDTTHIAYLRDRILMMQGKKQKFGTQFKADKNGMKSLYPVENRRGVDILRKQYGLPPLKDFLDVAKEYNDRIKHAKKDHSTNNGHDTVAG